MKSKAKIAAKDFVKIVEWSEEDQLYLGSAPPLIGPCCHGTDEAKVMRELAQIVAEWIEIYAEEGWPLPAPTAGRKYSGKFVLRTKPEVHRALALHALAEGQSLNAYCTERLAGAAAGERAATHRLGPRSGKRPRGTQIKRLSPNVAAR